MSLLTVAPRAIATAILASAVIGAAAIGGVPAASATTASPPEAAVPTISVLAAPTATGVLRDGDDLVVRITVANATTEPLRDARAQLHLSLTPLAGQPAVRAWLTDLAPPTTSVVATTELVDVAPGARAVATLTVDAADLDLNEVFGVRPAGVTVIDDAGRVVAHDRTAIVGQPAGTTTAGAGIVVIAPFTAPDDRGRFLNAEQLTALTVPGGRLDRTLDTAEGRGVALAIDPRILASIRLLGDQAPASATALLDRVAASRTETFALRYADADPLAAVGTLDVASPPALGAGSATLAGDGETSVELAELTAWPHALDGWVWPAEGTLTANAVDPLIAEGAGVVIAQASDLAAGEGLVNRVADELSVVTVDPLATALVRGALDEANAQARRAAAAELSALLATAPATSIPLVAAASRTAAPGPAMAQLLDDVTALPWGRTGSLGPATGLGALAGTARLVEREITSEHALDELLALEAADATFARIAIDPAPLLADRRLDLLDALAVGGPSAGEALENYASASQRLRTAVEVVESNTITLAGDRTSLPVTVQNGLPVDVRVFVRVEAATGALRVENPRVEATVPAQAQVRALVPVQSLVNGDVDIRVSLRAEDGEPIGAPIQLPLNLQAGWETAGTIALGGVIAALFAIGLARDIRRRRQQRASSADAESAPTPDETSTP